MLGRKNSIPERIISLAMTLGAFGLIYAALFLNKSIPKDIWGIAEFIYSAVI